MNVGTSLLFIKLAWRNTVRNKRRTLLTSTAIGVGLASLIFVDALIIGMNRSMIEAGTSTFLGEGQIHRQDFRRTLEANLTVNHLDRITAELEKDPAVEHFTRRTLSFSMITSPGDVSAISLIGVDPASERNLSVIHEAIIKGDYFAGNNERDLVLGDKLAKTLGIEVGDRLVVTVAQAGNGDLSQELFYVSGIFHLNIDEMDRSTVFIRLPKAQQMLGIGNNVHEVALKFTDLKYGEDPTLPFWQHYSRNGNEALGWAKLLPQVKTAMDLSSFSIYITGLILFSIIILVIINSLFMSLYERMFEFGVLRAIGTRPAALARLIILESVALAVISLILGMVLGFLVTYFFARNGINYNGIEYAGVVFRKPIGLVLTIRQFIYYPAWVLVFILLAGLYPAIYAARMSAVTAMRKSL